MSQGTELADSLARAIGEFREELLARIDTELARLHGPAPEEGRSVGLPEPETSVPPQPQADPGNPRQRLDALARLLDHRLKQVEGAPGTTGGRSQGIPEESPNAPGSRAAE